MKNSWVTRSQSLKVTKIACLCVMLALCLFFIPQLAQAATTNQISQFGITWTFDKDYEYGQFVNGDYWVVGPVTIININPPSTNIGGRIKNGSMLNPKYNVNWYQGFDNSTLYWVYNTAGNVAFNLPLTITTGSLVSTISNPVAGSRPQLTDAAVLTVLASAPVEGSFRPAYSSSTKTIKYNISVLDEPGKGYSILKNLASVTGTPTLSTCEGQLARPWLELNVSWIAQYLRPSNNQQVTGGYGEYLSQQYGDVILLLNINNTNANKRKLLIEAIQIGIDSYGGVQEGLYWVADGGHHLGHMLPILFAGLALGDSNMAAVGSMTNSNVPVSPYHNPQPAKTIFQEIQSTFNVNALSVSITQSNTPIAWTPDPRDAGHSAPYTNDMLEIPEYGIRHLESPQLDDAYLATGGAGTWSIGYRASFGAGEMSHALAMLILGAKSYVNHDVFFDYMDRWMTASGGAQGASSASTFAINMWNAYRANYGSIWPNKATILYGDVDGNGEVSAYDAALTAQAAVGLITLTAEQIQAADVSGEGEVSAYDAALIAQRAVGLISKFPVES